MDINSLWAVTRNICLSLLPGFWSSSCCCNLFTSDPCAVWSSCCLIRSFFDSLLAPPAGVLLSFSSSLFRLSLLTFSGDVILSHKHTYWSQPVFLTPCSRSLRDSAEFTAVWCLSFVEYTLFHWGSNWELKNTVLSPPNKLNLVLTHYQGELYFYHSPHCFVGIFVFKGHGLIKGTTKECSWTWCQNPLDFSHTAALENWLKYNVGS